MFNNDGVTFLRFFLNKCWRFFQITIPSTNITFAQLLFAILMTTFVIKLVMNIFNLVPSTGDRLTAKDKTKGGKDDR